MSNAAQQKVKHNLAIERPKLDNAQKLRGICYTDPDGMELQDTMKNARKKPQVPLESAVLCDISNQQGETWCTQHNSRTSRYACIVQANEPSRTRTGTTELRYHEDLIAEKRFNSLTHCNLVHKPILILTGCESRS